MKKFPYPTKGRAKAAALLLFVLGVLAAAPPALSAISGSGAAETVDPEQTGELLTPADEPVLRQDEVARAASDVSEDAAVKALINGEKYSISHTGIWTRSDDQHATKIGAVVRLHLVDPATLSGSWPTMQYDATAPLGVTPYSEGAVTRTQTNVSDLYVLVDLGTDRVVNVVPGPGSEPSPQPKTTGGDYDGA